MASEHGTFRQALARGIQLNPINVQLILSQSPGLVARMLTQLQRYLKI